jgi:hypothetical protein
MGQPDPALAVTSSQRLEVVVLVSRVDDGFDRAMRYVEHLGANDVHAVHVGDPSPGLGAEFWARYGRTLEFVPLDRGLVHTVRAHVRALRREHPDRVVAVVVPEVIEESRWWHVLRHSHALRLKAGLLFEPGVVVVNVPTLPTDRSLRGRAPRRHVALVPVGTLHAAAFEALQVANLLAPNEVRAVHLADNHEEAEALQDAWDEYHLRYPLDMIAAPYRELVPPLLEEIRAIKSEGADLVTVVVNELVPKWWQHGLHNHRALAMKAALLFEPGVAVASVPHHL